MTADEQLAERTWLTAGKTMTLAERTAVAALIRKAAARHTWRLLGVPLPPSIRFQYWPPEPKTPSTVPSHEIVLNLGQQYTNCLIDPMLAEMYQGDPIDYMGQDTVAHVEMLLRDSVEDTRITVPQLLWGSEAAHVARRHSECDEER